MLETALLTIRMRPLNVMELVTVRFLSRVGGDHAALFRSVARLRFLRGAIGGSLGSRAARGMAVAETALLFLAVDLPSETPKELRRKALLIRSFLETDSGGNAASMLAAGLESDARRLGNLAEVAASLAQ